jgi:hypothetical protein
MRCPGASYKGGATLDTGFPPQVEALFMGLTLVANNREGLTRTRGIIESTISTQSRSDQAQAQFETHPNNHTGIYV